MNQELSVNVSAKLSVSDETAERCLRLLEMWQEDNPDSRILCESREDGTIAMRIVPFYRTPLDEDEHPG